MKKRYFLILIIIFLLLISAFGIHGTEKISAGFSTSPTKGNCSGGTCIFNGTWFGVEETPLGQVIHPFISLSIKTSSYLIGSMVDKTELQELKKKNRITVPPNFKIPIKAFGEVTGYGVSYYDTPPIEFRCGKVIIEGKVQQGGVIDMDLSGLEWKNCWPGTTKCSSKTGEPTGSFTRYIRGHWQDIWSVKDVKDMGSIETIEDVKAIENVKDVSSVHCVTVCENESYTGVCSIEDREGALTEPISLFIQLKRNIFKFSGPSVSISELKGIEGIMKSMAVIDIDPPSYCGKEGVQYWFGEKCDEGEKNSDNTPDVCRKNCQLPHCGDGVKDSRSFSLNHKFVENINDPFLDPDVNPDVKKEECDDGNNEDGDGCSAECKKEKEVVLGACIFDNVKCPPNKEIIIKGVVVPTLDLKDGCCVPNTDLDDCNLNYYSTPDRVLIDRQTADFHCAQGCLPLQGTFHPEKTCEDFLEEEETEDKEDDEDCDKCDSCGNGFFNICDKQECESLGPCKFKPGLFGIIFNSCEPDPDVCQTEPGETGETGEPGEEGPAGEEELGACIFDNMEGCPLSSAINVIVMYGNVGCCLNTTKYICDNTYCLNPSSGKRTIIECKLISEDCDSPTTCTIAPPVSLKGTYYPGKTCEYIARTYR